MHIRKATLLDVFDIKRVYLQAFDDSENMIVADFAVNLLSDRSTIEILSLVAVQGDVLIGHIAFSPVFLDETAAYFAYILAPLAVSPQHQKTGIGSALVRHGLELISSLGTFLIFVYGDLNYYSRFGFRTELADNFTPPYPLQYPDGWRALKIGESSIPKEGAIRCVDALNNPLLW